MNAVHIRTFGMFCDQCPPRIETELESMYGVKAARTYRTMRLTSVLYDPEIIDADAIRDRITKAGFDISATPGVPTRREFE